METPSWLLVARTLRPEAHIADHVSATQWVRDGRPPQGGWPPEALWRAAGAMFVGMCMWLLQHQRQCYGDGGGSNDAMICHYHLRRGVAQEFSLPAKLGVHEKNTFSYQLFKER